MGLLYTNEIYTRDCVDNAWKRLHRRYCVLRYVLKKTKKKTIHKVLQFLLHIFEYVMQVVKVRTFFSYKIRECYIYDTGKNLGTPGTKTFDKRAIAKKQTRWSVCPKLYKETMYR